MSPGSVWRWGKNTFPFTLSFVHLPVSLHPHPRQALTRLSLVASIVVDPAVQAQEMTQNAGEEISRMIVEQKELEKRFAALVEQQQALRGMVNQSKLKETTREVKQVSDELRESTARLCRNLKSNPNVAENIAKVTRHRLDLRELLIRSGAELIEKRRLYSVHDFVVDTERRRRQDLLRASQQREASDAVRELKIMRASEEKAHSEDMARRRAALTREKEKLKVVKVSNEETALYTRRSRLGTNECHRNARRAELQALEEEVRRLKLEMKIEERVHRELTAFQQAKTDELAGQTKEWTSGKEIRSTKLDRSTAAITVSHQKALLSFKKVEDEYNFECRKNRERDDIIIGRRLKKLFEDPAVEAKYVRCACTVQRAWKSMQRRRTYAQVMGGLVMADALADDPEEAAAKEAALEKEREREARIAAREEKEEVVVAEVSGESGASGGGGGGRAAAEAPAGEAGAEGEGEAPPASSEPAATGEEAAETS